MDEDYRESEGFDWDAAKAQFNELGDFVTALQEIAKLVMPLYKAFRAEGADVDEAAALTHMFMTKFNQPPQQPQED